MEVKMTFTIQENDINGITGPNKKEVIDSLFKKNKKIVYLGNLTLEEYQELGKKIYIVEEDMHPLQYQQKVYECMYDELRRRKLSIINPKKKVLNSLKIVGLEPNILERRVKDLSSSERKKLQIGLCLMNNPDLIILYEPFNFFDKKSEKEIVLLLQMIKEQYDKTIILVSNNCEILLKYTNYLIITTEEKILEGKTIDLYEKVDELKKAKIPVPEIIEFTSLAKKRKNIKLEYHKDVRDIIKDIYKHV